jgi:hypothetical protein
MDCAYWRTQSVTDCSHHQFLLVDVVEHQFTSYTHQQLAEIGLHCCWWVVKRMVEEEVH